MKYKKPRIFKTFGLLLALPILFALPAAVLAAESYPSRPVRLVVPYPPGGGNEVTGRLMSAKLTERLGKPVIVDNRGGAAGVIGSEMVAKAEPDGYTLLFIAPSHVTNPALQKLPYDPVKSFAPIAKLGNGPYALVVHPSVPANSVKEFIALAKQKPAQLIFSTAGITGINHMAAELLKQMAATDFKIVHYKGGGPALLAVVGGHANAEIASLSTAMPQIKSGKLKVLAICGVNRSPLLPDVPTVAESGFRNYEISGFWGILAPARTPAPIVDRLSKEIKAILATDEAKKVIESQGSVVDYLGPAELGKFLEKQISTWTSVAKKANIKLEDQN